jgi:Alw26I/Eco31I/Esp3I family type II restriction endonuclease
MSNAPDRFDGFHTYNACCRKEKDTGRHDDNMKNYTRDRRAFEKWADGDFTLANQIMGEFLKYKETVICPGCGENKKMSADHIGPISLGFCHRKEFNPLCSSCNSSKNNRMTLNDVKTLLGDENNGKEVISLHSKFIWDKLKYLIKTDEEAKIASNIMRENMHYILASLNIIYQYTNGYDFLLTKLNPEYVKYKYKITNFNPLALNEMKITSTISNADTKISSEKRYIQISFEELGKYNEKENRIYNEKLLAKYDQDFIRIKKLLLASDFNQVNENLLLIFQSIASELESKFKNS